VIWSLTGLSKTQLDRQGELMISDTRGLRAFDLTGREILPVEGRLILPFGEVPVYITSESLSVMELRDRIAGGIIRHVTPVNLYALSLNHSAEQKQTLSVRMQNQLNRSINGMLTLRIDQSREQSSAHFAIPAGTLPEVAIEWPGIAVSAENQYPITLTVRLDDDQSQSPASEFLPVVRDQSIAVANFTKQTIKVNGPLDDWSGITPVMLIAGRLRTAVIRRDTC
jgi:hypothetical protein